MLWQYFLKYLAKSSSYKKRKLEGTIFSLDAPMTIWIFVYDIIPSFVKASVPVCDFSFWTKIP